MIVNKTKQKMRNGEPVLMAFIALNDATSAEVIAMSGVDIVVIDNEHRGFDDQAILNISRIVKLHGATCLLRTTIKDVKALSHYMDLGIDGFCATMTSTVEEVEAVVEATKYHPLGGRGISGMCTGFNYGFTKDMNIGEYMEHLNDNTIIVITIESEEGLKNLDDMLKVDGIDAIDVGAGDLSLSMGHKADKNHPEVVRLVKEAERKIIESGMITSASALTPDEIAKEIEKGEKKILMIGTDIVAIRNTFIDLVKAV